MPQCYRNSFGFPRVHRRVVEARFDGGESTSDGATREEARDLLRELIAGAMREGTDLPEPSRATKRRPLVVPLARFS